ncbi:2-succinyl-5-enolpyruvyl-6-hydroxy-3-cyclohexene-1-carboxylic-acid synthase [Cytobacillus oceanisediminis]|jgi:2-succinyl-5-enolpyruvyl-6-hydroxy-3-cyclohexene-1-carboxylate synthase|uniref:2-succinyl-5-enolpyruvyl-6-hydroxy-3-cyclohexene-1-carboxylate synthase n=2 Tax=Niallia TaxID=2837506 RepID=A0A941GDA1_NIACI|nr:MULTISPECIES: 2-succinyl-5-enolpyruvyl-6-hydroxy-3-cyclohexene-1-carboxylic-acid synthase [Bacillaceae]MBQ6446684.1 2-succinyl-5-enolpyruvyl-6-hydroxy-3-cyclohexene-1-carboxylic-acid synthase [Bacillus sp. (in: firmicutes)]MDU1846739.1 2-succinyl-5-enolpyruvyl-6-hydroxy-3-cyclohexene-1-carboxylic-acid synthase [Niallia nealsonii]MBZ9535721.1 2-succinyl-5-enolpyruvyl-6-hydroxy-3-cyclohexene-1-carboxylic-acid synthase [Cytobacillus oceanisediminis]MCB5238463.1 2-succinyl-5-enolpyruvyl-6-hydrox
MSHQQQLTAYVHALISELVKNGVAHAVISPGSRSTPISLLLAEEEDIQLHVHVDERSAAFFALGIAKASKKPTVLVCTSGTAAANYFPAIVEAKISRIPLVVLTADRPHELRDVGAPQAIDQLDLYGKHVKWFMEMATPDSSPGMIRYAKTVGARAIAMAKQHPSGPVHVNIPLREPLIPDLDNLEYYRLEEQKKTSIQIQTGEFILSDSYFQDLVSTLNKKEDRKGIIICGEINNEEFFAKVIKLAGQTGFPIIADPLSQLRSKSADKEIIIDTYDTFLRNEKVKSLLKPDVIIRFGSMPVSKPLTIFLRENEQAKQIVVDGGSGYRDPNQLTTEMVYCEEGYFCEKLTSVISHCSLNHYLNKWIEINELTKKELMQTAEIQEISEAKLFHSLGELIPNDAVLFVGNSMPIRDLDTFFHKQNKEVTIVANRGANGIDGTISTALGVGVIKQPLFLIVGDLTFFHDLNGLILSQLYQLPITVLLINNNGGGIFSFLPQVELPRHFELLFGTPLDIDFKHAVEMYKGEYELIKSWQDLQMLFQKSNFTAGLRVWELQTNRERNLLEHRQMTNRIQKVLDQLV